MNPIFDQVKKSAWDMVPAPQAPAGATPDSGQNVPGMIPTPGGSKFVMCRPTYLSTKISNNVFMEGKNKEPADVPRALNEHDRIAHVLEAFGVEIFEMPPEKGCQDMCFVANIGVAIEPYIVLANYKAPGRACEVPPAKRYFESLGYQCIIPPKTTEGEADMKLWKKGHYFCGIGQFSTKESFDWIAKKTGVKTILLEEIDPQAYHLDCSLLVIDEENFLVNKAGLSPDSIKILQKCGNVTFTPDGVKTTGITNGVLIPEKKIYMSGAFNPELPDYRKAMEFLLEAMDKFGYTTVFNDADAFNPSGGDLSCLVFHLTFPPNATH
jgi:N-dimethylarginine dimethylaminohydrolase